MEIEFFDLQIVLSDLIIVPAIRTLQRVRAYCVVQCSTALLARESLFRQSGRGDLPDGKLIWVKLELVAFQLLVSTGW